MTPPGKQRRAGGVDAQHRQPVGEIGAGVEVDAVRAKVDALDRRMAVDDDEAEVAVVVEEFVADAGEIGEGPGSRARRLA